ncbi:MAG: lanthionine synthetase C family protein [Trebonia sp.]
MTAATAAASPQSLARGAAGTALLVIEQALTGGETWTTAHQAISAAFAEEANAGPGACLLHGVPALALVLRAAQTDGHRRYQAEAQVLSEHVARMTRQQLAAATALLESGSAGSFRVHDLFFGLAGFGTVLLRTDPEGEALADILRYLVRLTRPRTIGGTVVPGWWASDDPDTTVQTPGGHLNLGMAHGGAAILALMSLCARHGVTVDGQQDAIRSLACWYTSQQRDSPHGPWWPQWLTLVNLRDGSPGQSGGWRPSWCYGAAGISRALQLAAIAVGDGTAQAAAEQALAACLEPTQLARLTEPGLCHGLAGLYMTALRAAHDARSPDIAARLPAAAVLLAGKAGAAEGSGLLTGSAGVRLALEAARNGPPRSGWDACLLIT